ncbi:eukaryotic aspartyl protease [Xylariaceae sp. FL0804]|nr:eukaryotic aspartyl protease [Xylariaceae sp. FL0804]
MRSYSAAALAAAFLLSHDLVSAVPTAQKRALLTPEEVYEVSTLGGMTFRVPQVRNQRVMNMTKGRGQMALARAYSKYGGELSADLLSYIEKILEELGLLGSSSSSGTNKMNMTTTSPKGEVAARPQMFDSEYLCPVQIGTPQQTLMLDFDTGSSDLWVFSSQTPSAEVDGQTVYDIAASSTAQQLEGSTWSISYGDGSSSSGDVYLDTVSVGGVTVDNQAVESASEVSTSFTQRTTTDGLLGLAFSTLNTVSPQQQQTFFDNALVNLASPLFTANLKASEPGNYNFGFIDPSEFEGDISYISVNTSQGFWQFAADGFTVGDSGAQSLAHEGIADTGTTLVLVPAAIAAAYYAQVSGAQDSASAGGWVFSCDADLPDFAVNIGSYSGSVPGEYIRYSPVDGNSFATASTCYGGIQAVPAGIDFAIYGDVFLKAHFVVFNGGTEQLGFAQKPLT